MPIKGLQRRMAVLGHIKIGGREKRRRQDGSEYTLPVKYDHFKITTTEQGDLGYIEDRALTMRCMTEQLRILISEHTEKIYDDHNKLVRTVQTTSTADLEEENPTLTRILVALPFDDPDQNLVTSLATYDRNGCRCRGDADKAEYIDPQTGEVHPISCPCNLFMSKLGDHDDVTTRQPHQFAEQGMAAGGKYKCKANGNLRLMIAAARTLGGIHQFRTTSMNSIRQLFAAMDQVREITGGALAGVPLVFEMKTKYVQPEPNKPNQKVYTVTLTHKASINEFLRDVAQLTSDREAMRQQIASKEILSLPEPGRETAIEQIGVAQEFYATDVEPDDVVADDAGEDVTDKIEETPPDDAEIADEGADQEEESEEPPPEPSFVTAKPEGADTSKASKDLRKDFFRKARAMGYTDEQIRNWLKALWDIESSASLETWQTQAMVNALENTAGS